MLPHRCTAMTARVPRGGARRGARVGTYAVRLRIRSVANTGVARYGYGIG